MSMGMSFFTSCPLTGGFSVPLHTVCTSNLSLFYKVFVCAPVLSGLPTRLCEACSGAIKQELEPVSEIFSGLNVSNKSLHARSGPGAWLKKDIPMLIYLTKDTSVALRKG
jgi:hypothetical protein